MLAVSAVILNGGSSRRMGTDKSALRVGGSSLLQRVADAMGHVAEDVMIAGGTPPDDEAALRELGARAIVDAFPGAGPLAGIEAALRLAYHEVVLVAGVDMPFLSEDLLTLVARRASHSGRAAVAMSDRGLEPLLAAYPASAASMARRQLIIGRRDLQGFVAQVGFETVGPRDWRPLDGTGRSFVNVNRPQDLAAARELARTGPWSVT
jgi:molybdopterin-guanine dinucleotide biosynthesis protein A